MAAAAPMEWLVVDAGASKDLAGSRTYTAYEEANTWFRVASGKTVCAAYDASVPLVLKDCSGQGFLRRSTWSVVREDGPGDAPCLRSSSQIANWHMVLDLGADSIVVKTSSGKPVVLATGVRGGHLVLPTHPWGRAGNPGAAGGPGRHSATCDPKSAVRASQVPRRAHARGRPERAFGFAESRCEETFLADRPDALAIGVSSCRLANLDGVKLRKIHTQLLRADANHTWKRVSPAVDPGRPGQERAKALIRKVSGSRKA